MTCQPLSSPVTYGVLIVLGLVGIALIIVAVTMTTDFYRNRKR
jgi:hypothetical protein